MMGCQRSKTLPLNVTLPGTSAKSNLAGWTLHRENSKVTPGMTDECKAMITTTSSQQMTDFQVDVIRCTWPLVSADTIISGAKVFFSAFAAEPRVKALFPFRDLNNDQLLQNALFRVHVTKFMTSIGDVCDQLPDMHLDSEVSRKLMVLGGHHATIAGFDFAYLRAFVESLDSTWEKILGEEYTEEVREAWQEVFEYVIDRLRDGYHIFHEQDNSVTLEHCKSSLERYADPTERQLTQTAGKNVQSP